MTEHIPGSEAVIKFAGGIIGYRFTCSCGRVGNGTHPTVERALKAALDHTKPPKPPKPPRPLTIEQRFSSAVEILAENDFTRDDIWEQIAGIAFAMRQGSGLTVTQMEQIISKALDTTSQPR